MLPIAILAFTFLLTATLAAPFPVAAPPEAHTPTVARPRATPRIGVRLLKGQARKVSQSFLSRRAGHEADEGGTLAPAWRADQAVAQGSSRRARRMKLATSPRPRSTLTTHGNTNFGSTRVPELPQLRLLHVPLCIGPARSLRTQRPLRTLQTLGHSPPPAPLAAHPGGMVCNMTFASLQARALHRLPAQLFALCALRPPSPLTDSRLA